MVTGSIGKRGGERYGATVGLIWDSEALCSSMQQFTECESGRGNRFGNRAARNSSLGVDSESMHTRLQR